jgi:hypothetical protein|tara:strand:- start:450 stop:617 length:168 start_codon:yes stop_codon:yes gene_type:complete
MTKETIPLKLIVNQLENDINADMDDLGDQFYEKLREFNEACEQLNKKLTELKGGL